MRKEIALFSLIGLLVLSGCGHTHSWTAANCITARTCKDCGETEGTPVGHIWVDATCTTPQTCSACSKTEGEALGHTWNEATCSLPKTCSTCNVSDGKPLAHSWTAATCTTPKICEYCSEVEGEALGHTEGTWVDEEPNISAGYTKKVKYCTVCEIEIDSEIAFLSTMHKDGLFLFTPNEFSSRLESVFNVLDYDMTTKIGVLDDNSLVCGILKDGELIAAVSFSNNSDFMDSDEQDDRNITAMMTYYYIEDVEDVIACMVSIMVSCDPQLDADDARILGAAVTNAAKSNDAYKHHGISYLLGIVNDKYILVTSVLEK